MELTPEQIENLEKLDARNLLKAALLKIREGKPLTRREIAAVRQAKAIDPSASAGARFMEQAKENTQRFKR
jgi:hypothetical protein